MKKINIIDSFGLFFRLYYAMMGLRSATGTPSGMVSGLATFIEKMNRDFPCDYAINCIFFLSFVNPFFLFFL